MSCGLSLIVSNEEPFDEIVSQDCGILIDPNNQKQIIDSILSLKDKIKEKKSRNFCKVKSPTTFF